jgi:multidrug efflux pump subunit AcrA (membrane-fusion protein)
MKQKKRGKKIIAVIALIFAAGAACAFYTLKKNSSPKEKTESYTVRKETHNNVIEIAGTINAANSQKLQAAGTGRVAAVYAKEGDKIKKGETILKLDDTEQKYNLERHLYDMDQKRINGAPRELELMRAQQTVLEQRLRDKQVEANFDGVLAKFSAKVGDVFEAKDEVGVIIDRSYLQAVVEVVETDAPKLKAGQKVTFRFPAYSIGRVEGYVVSFPAVGTVTSRGATVVEAKIRIDDPPEAILPNYSFTGQIEVRPPTTVLLVEREAIDYVDGKPYAEKMNGDKFERVAVQVEMFGRDHVSVISGLEEGDVVKALRPRAASGQGRRGGDSPPPFMIMDD